LRAGAHKSFHKGKPGRMGLRLLQKIKTLLKDMQELFKAANKN